MDRPVIVVVEDDSGIARMLHAALTEIAGYQALTAPDGAQALEVIAATHPDLIIADVNLPDIDGFALCDRLHSQPATAALPCLFMSARRCDAELTRRGITDFLAKPFDLDELLAHVETLVAAPPAPEAAASP
jgi:DNA-binding response OmpR family regulator